MLSWLLSGTKCVPAEGSVHLETDGKVRTDATTVLRLQWLLLLVCWHGNHVCHFSLALSGGCSSSKALQQEHIHRESGRPPLLSRPHVQPCRLVAAIQTHIKPAAQQQLPLWSKPRYCVQNFAWSPASLALFPNTHCLLKLLLLLILSPLIFNLSFLYQWLLVIFSLGSVAFQASHGTAFCNSVFS